jgi:hypothetical protein
MANKVKKPLVNVTIHIDTLLEKYDSLSEGVERQTKTHVR